MSISKDHTGTRFQKRIKEILIKHKGHIKLKELYEEFKYNWNTPIEEDVLIFTVCNMLDDGKLNMRVSNKI